MDKKEIYIRLMRLVHKYERFIESSANEHERCAYNGVRNDVWALAHMVLSSYYYDEQD